MPHSLDTLLENSDDAMFEMGFNVAQSARVQTFITKAYTLALEAAEKEIKEEMKMLAGASRKEGDMLGEKESRYKACNWLLTRLSSLNPPKH